MNHHHVAWGAQNFRGVYAHAASVKVNGLDDPNVKAFGARDADQIVVMPLNQNQGTPALPYNVRLPQCSTSGGGDCRPQLAQPFLARAGAPRHATTEARDEPDAESQGLASSARRGRNDRRSPANPEVDALHLLPELEFDQRVSS